MPLNIMEGMICGKPIIASDNRGHRELIHDKENGILVDPNKEKEFFKEICNLMKDREKQYNYGKKSLNYIKPYDIKNIKKIMSYIYGISKNNFYEI
jgi:glycosyltransferase EpsD